MNRMRILRLLASVGVLLGLGLSASTASALDYLIEVQSGGPGNVSPTGNVIVPAGSNATFTFSPTGCYAVGDVTVDDVSVGSGITEYTFTNVQSDHILYVPFGARTTSTVLNVRPVVGQCAVPETLTATVANADGGQVQFFVGATSLGTSTLSAGTAKYVVAAGRPTGAYTFSATYLGSDCSDASVSPGVAYNVADTGPTPVALVLTASTSFASTILTIGNAVAPQTGQVTYYDGATAVATVLMSNGHSSLSNPIAGTPGAHVLTAVASLSLCSGTVTSNPETLVVADNRTPTITTLTIEPNQVDIGTPAVLRAVVNRPNISGTITFYDVTSGSTQIGVVTPSGSIAFLNYTPTGSYRTIQIQAVYSGDAGYKGSTSNPASLQFMPLLFMPPFTPYTTADGPGFVATGRLDADTKIDLAVTCATGNVVTTFPGNGDGTFYGAARSDWGTGGNPRTVAIADLNADGRNDLVVACQAGAVSVLLDNGDGTFGPRTDFGSASTSASIADLNGDGIPDLAATSATASVVSVLLGNGNGTFGAATSFPTGVHPYFVATGDLNGDGKYDLVVADDDSLHLEPWEHGTTIEVPGGEVSVLLGNGDGTFASRTRFLTGQSPHFVALADLNADGALDLVIANYGFGGSGQTVSVLRGLGNGTFASQVQHVTGAKPNSVAIGDYNADGHHDLAVAQQSSVAVLLGNGDTSFMPLLLTYGGIGNTSVASGHFNGDAKLDLAVAVPGSNLVSIFLNTQSVAPLDVPVEAVPSSNSISLLGSNPTRTEARIQYTIARAGHVRLDVVDVTGRVVEILFEGTRPAGRYQTAWTGTERDARLAAGLYFLRLAAPDGVVAAKVTRFQ